MTMEGTVSTIRIGKVRRDVLFVKDHCVDLMVSRVPGTRRPWAQTRTRAESRQLATDEHDVYARTVLGLTATPAAAHVDVLDAVTDVLAISHALSDAVAQKAGVVRLDPPISAYADPRPYLDHVLAHIETADEASGGAIIDEALDGKSDLSIVRARARTAAALRLILGGQVLDADCPWCDARPLRIRIVNDEPLVVCEARRVCEPPEADCGTWVRGRPAWILPEWDWLAQRIRHAEDVVSA